MRIRKKKWAEPELSVCDFFVKNPEEHAGKWKSAFKKEQPLVLEIGCGKGGFAGQFALQHPEINIIALDIKIDMLGVGRAGARLLSCLRKTAKPGTILRTFCSSTTMSSSSIRLLQPTTKSKGCS